MLEMAKLASHKKIGNDQGCCSCRSNPLLQAWAKSQKQVALIAKV
jgi:hypothetical protein